ncbi:MAG: CPBP family intramembrane glutamic endopeptidase [Bacillota bacterium]
MTSGLVWVAVVVVLPPLVNATLAGYDSKWWRQWGRVDLLPFPSPLFLFSPLWAWHLGCWICVAAALFAAVQSGSIASLVVLAAAVELLYAVIAPRGTEVPPPESFPYPVLVFGLWHNALMEELLFRGLPLFIAGLSGASNWAPWPLLYIASTALLFGLYHRWQIGPRRLVDTTAFGAVLGFVTLQYGLLSAILLHLLHNSLTMPTPPPGRVQRWWHRRVYLIFLATAAILALL